MEVSTNVARAMVAAQGDYDAHCKRLLADRQVIARVLAGTLDEYSEVPVEVVERDLIDGEPTIDAPMGRDDPGRPLLLESEDSVGEGLVRFDVRVRVRAPGTDDGSGMPRLLELDLEPQGRTRPGYPLLCRALYYCGRMISQQGGGVVAHSDYGRLRKVVSVWVCLEPLEANRATVAAFEVRQRDLSGKGSYDRSDYDRLEVVVIGLGSGSREAGGVVGMLATLLDADMEPEKKLAVLHDEYGMMVSQSIEREVRDMGGVGQAIYDEAFEKGEDSGSLKRLVACVRGAITGFGATAEEALQKFGVPRDEWQAVIDLLQATSK